MSLKISYRFIAKLYNICEVLFFRQKSTSPRQVILRLLPKNSIEILDIATGTATGCILIAEHNKNCNIVGIDSSREMLDIANKKIKKRNLSNLQTVLMDASILEFDSNTFDIIIISLLLHETGNNLAKKILSEAKRVLKPDGKIFIVEWEQPEHLFQKFMFSIIRFFESESFDHFLHTSFEKYFADKELTIINTVQCDYTRIFELQHIIQNY